MNIFLLNFCYQMITLFPCVLLCYLPFMDRLACAKTKIAVVSTLGCIINSLTYSITNTVFGFDESGNIHVAFFMLVGFLYYRKTVREGLHKLLFVFCIAIHAGSITGGMEIVLELIPDFSIAQRDFFWLLLCTLIRLVLYPPMGWVLCRVFAPRLRHIKSQVMKWMWVVPVIFSVISIYYYTNYFHTGAVDPAYPAVYLLLAILSFLLYHLLLRMLDGAAKNAQLELQVMLTNQQLGMQREQYSRVAENAAQIKIMRHDLRHNLIAIKKFSDSGNTDELNAYIDHLVGDLTAADDRNYCKNNAVNAVLSHYLGMAEKEGVTIETRFSVPQDTGNVPTIDLCVIMGNFLENAVEACRRMKHGSKYIRVRSRIAGDTLSIVVINSFDGLWHEENGIYLSRKKADGDAVREGIGLSSVKVICEKHQGLVQYKISEDVWQSSALVHMEAKIDMEPSE